MLDRRIYKTNFLCTESLESTFECLLCQKQLLSAPIRDKRKKKFVYTILGEDCCNVLL